MSLRTRLLLLILFATLIPALVAGMRFFERRDAEIGRGRGTLYDAEVADACLRLFGEKGYGVPA